jgi:hypothetical protein
LSPIDEETPSTTRIVEVEEYKRDINISIENLTHVGK